MLYSATHHWLRQFLTAGSLVIQSTVISAAAAVSFFARCWTVQIDLPSAKSGDKTKVEVEEDEGKSFLC